MVCQSRAPAFEVASIKPVEGRVAIDLKTYPNRLTATCTISQLITSAYSVESRQLTGLPEWSWSDFFHVEAKSTGDFSRDSDRVMTFRGPVPRQMMLMLQTLLAERFQVKVHRETREGTVFALLSTNGKAKLQIPSETTSSAVHSGATLADRMAGKPEAIVGHNASMGQLAQYLSRELGRPVEDQTGIAGNYDFHFAYAPEEASSVAPSLFTAIEEATGLRLKATKGPVEFLVVDRAAKPSAN